MCLVREVSDGKCPAGKCPPEMSLVGEISAKELSLGEVFVGEASIRDVFVGKMSVGEVSGHHVLTAIK